MMLTAAEERHLSRLMLVVCKRASRRAGDGNEFCNSDKDEQDILDAARENVVAFLHTITVAALEKMEADKKRPREAAETWVQNRVSERGCGSKRARR